MAKTKTMCKWNKSDIEKRFDKFRDLVSEPTHACKSCGRVARKKKVLCKPIEL